MSSNLVRLNIMLTREEAAALRALALERQKSQSQLVRDSLMWLFQSYYGLEVLVQQKKLVCNQSKEGNNAK